MVEDSSSGARPSRFDQASLCDPPDEPAGWVEPHVAGHDVRPPGGTEPPGPGRWRLTGVPARAAVAALVLAVALVLALGRGGTGEEVLLGPGEPTGPAHDVTTGGAGTVEDAAGPATEDRVGPGAPAGPGGPGAEAVPDAADQATVAPDVAAGPLLVHVDGAVQRPGVVQVPVGSRVTDAVDAAGGVTDEADTRLVNLARPLQDGELVVVPRPGEASAGAPGAGGGDVALPLAGAAATGPAAGAAEGGTAAVDLNHADVTALDTLPGVGPVLAQRIVDHREHVGPFAAVDDLTAVSGIGPAVLERLRARATV